MAAAPIRRTAGVLAALMTAPAHAHDVGGDTWWSMWTLAPAVVSATLLVLCLYWRGASKAGPWRRAGFLSGTALLFLALQSPLDALAQLSFAAHQMQHLVLLSVAPMLLALSAPAGPLLAGMPGWLLRRVYMPVAGNSTVRAAFRFLARPPAAAALFIVTLLAWLTPGAQAAALGTEWVHDSMHFSMLFAGLFFFFSAFDPRPPPQGNAYGARIFALLAALFVNIPLGAYLSYKQTVLYTAYPSSGRLGRAPLLDEQLGGLVQYVPGSMMFVLAVLIALGAWHRSETRREGWRRRGLAAGASPEPADALPRRNRRLAATLAAVCAFMFAAAILGGVLALR